MEEERQAKSQKSSESGAGGGGYGMIEEAAGADDSKELNSEDFKRPRSRKRSWRSCVFLADLMNLGEQNQTVTRCATRRDAEKSHHL